MDSISFYHCLLSLLRRQISEPRLGLGLASPLKTLCLKGIGLQRRQRVAKAFSVAPWRVCFFPSSPKPHSGVTLTPRNYDDIRKFPLRTVPNQPNSDVLEMTESQNTNFQTHSSPSTWIINSTTATNDKNLWVGACHNPKVTRSQDPNGNFWRFKSRPLDLMQRMQCQLSALLQWRSKSLRSHGTALHITASLHYLKVRLGPEKSGAFSHCPHGQTVQTCKDEKSTCAWWQCHAQSS